MHAYIYLFVPFGTLILAQLIKFTIESLHHRKLVWGRLFNGCGGMPSSHTSFSFSLTNLILLEQGVTSPIFAVSLIFSLIVAYDSMGLRRESGLQAETINKILDEMFEENPLVGMKRLKEQLGHKPLEVLMGILLGVFTSICVFYFL